MALLSGYARVEITPPDGYPRPQWGGQSQPSQGSVRPLDCRVTALADGTSIVFLLSLDLCALGEAQVQELRSALQGGGKRTLLLANCSHTHEAPLLVGEANRPDTAGYEQELFRRIARCCQRAEENLAPATVRFASREVEHLNQNRRNVENPLDRSLSVVVLDDHSGSPAHLLWRFSAHPLIHMNLERAWSSDFPGAVNEIMEKDFPGTACQFLQGAAGDVFPLDWHFRQSSIRYPMGERTEKEFSERLASCLRSLVEEAQPLHALPLLWKEKGLELPARRVSWSVSEVEALLAQEDAAAEAYEPWPADSHVVNIAQRHEKRYRLMGLNNALAMAREGSTSYPCRITALRVGSLYMASIPGEPFSVDAVRLQASTGTLPCMVLGYTNGYLSYLPNREAMQQIQDWTLQEFVDQRRNRWAYGATITTWVDADASDRIVNSLQDLLKELAETP